MKRSIWTATIAVVGFAAAGLSAQQPVRVEEDADCDWPGRETERYCEVREYVLDARARLTVDAGGNGGIQVSGWDRDEIRLEARIQATRRDGDPRELAREIEVRTGDVIEPVGPRARRGEGWSVSFELRVPRATDLRLEATNGGIGLEQLAGEVEARTTNGGISLVGGEGHVRGETTNGGLHVELVGASWRGGGVDLRTTNGGVRITVPEGYSADLETGTVNGGMEIDIPIMVQGRIDRTLRSQLGSGGALIRARTTNGGVVIGRS
jgi:hypothetical protein